MNDFRKRMLWTATAASGLIASLTIVPTLAADTVRLKSGEVFEGDLSVASITVESPEHGRAVMPVDSIAVIRFEEGDAGERVFVELVDGTTISGRLLTDRIQVDRELFSSTLAPAEIAEITFHGREESPTIPPGAPVRLDGPASASPEDSLVVSVPLFELADREPGEQFSRKLDQFVVFDTSVDVLRITYERNRRVVRLDVRTYVKVLPRTHDKWVAVGLTLKDGDDTLARERKVNVDAEEGKIKEVRMELEVPRERFDEALASEKLRLEVYLHARE